VELEVLHKLNSLCASYDKVTRLSSRLVHVTTWKTADVVHYVVVIVMLYCSRHTQAVTVMTVTVSHNCPVVCTTFSCLS